MSSGLVLLLVVGLASAYVIRAARMPTGVPAPRVSISAPASPSASPSAVPTPTPTSTPTPTPTPTPVLRPQPTVSSAAPSSVAPTGKGTTEPSDPAPTPSPTPTPDRSLKKNSLYRVDLGKESVSCRLKVVDPRPPLKNAALAPYLREVVKCLVKTFEEPLAEQGFELTTPKIRTYRKSISTPCGKYGEGAAPAYYCSATETIYWPESSDDGDEAYTFARLGYVGLTAHEFGHHLQAVTGMLTNYGIDYYGESRKKKQYEMSRRLELQAQCFEGVFLTTVRKSIDYDDGDRDELFTWHGFTGDEDPPDSRKPDHGSSEAQQEWLDRGLDSGDFGDCNTWTASQKQIT